MNTTKAAGVARALPRELIGYAIASAVALGVDAGLLYALVRYAGWHYQWAAACSFTLGAFVAYALSVKLAFRSHRLRNRPLELFTFVLLGLAGLAVNSLALFIAVSKLSLMVLPAKALAALCTFATNFVVRRQLLFTPASHGTHT